MQKCIDFFFTYYFTNVRVANIPTTKGNPWVTEINK